ncbi:hypothetical protein FFLO_06715 [Filobasidium floriforme]|uniref:Uncharacterized protein n=1 Tax=Filobasidium floriforme TaxID=5210 RepID=A0A8K0JEB9_9TREE|nr:uncharacterized protein HD553DRAFT_346628 [Filobasidium floriforme]KAG7527653.1 hypothetical protein FFLO_06715 [Filobasidium floriforme]KAH8077454.1 hypothetical protein HD553DRAFT_346628 [Filobasidium floriforme]
MFSSQSFFTGLLALLSLSQTVSSFAYQPPANTDDSRLVQNETYTFRFIGVSNGTFSLETSLPRSGDIGPTTNEEVIETNITAIGPGPAQYYNWTHTVTEPLGSNLTVSLKESTGEGANIKYLVVEENQENSGLGHPTASLWIIGASALVISASTI